MFIMSKNSNIKKEILGIQSKLTPFVHLELYKSHLTNLQNHIEILTREILKGKEKKFQRDTFHQEEPINGTLLKMRKTIRGRIRMWLGQIGKIHL